MPRKRSQRLSPEAREIEQILREEKLDLMSGAAASVRPDTKRALEDLDLCCSMADVYDMVRRNVAWHDRLLAREIDRAREKRAAEVDW